MRRLRGVLVVLVGTAAAVAGLTACGSSAGGPSGEQAGRQAPATQQVGSPEQELDQIGSTLDRIDRELAGDEAP
ncbi:hypothetical protein [Kribbella sp. NPDC004536]|uniref:hypothetical protein n=1 Tax=Kribbella sp. NPDC004536 TaxID=3364106 RepID=UPI0036C31232